MLITDSELVERFPGVLVNPDNRAFYAGWLEEKLLLNRCSACGYWDHPPKPMCPECWSTNVLPTEVSGLGTVYMLIWLRQGPPAEGVDYSTPYPVAVVELDEQPGLRFTGTILEASKGGVEIGDRVQLAWTTRAGAPMPAFRQHG